MNYFELGERYINLNLDKALPKIRQERENIINFGEKKKYAVIMLTAAIASALFAVYFSFALVAGASLILAGVAAIGIADFNKVAANIRDMEEAEKDDKTKEAVNATFFAMRANPQTRREFYKRLTNETLILKHLIN